MKQIYRAALALFLCVCMALSLASCGKNLGVRIGGDNYTLKEYDNILKNDRTKAVSFVGESATFTGCVVEKYKWESIKYTVGGETMDCTYPVFITLAENTDNEEELYGIKCCDILQSDFDSINLGDIVTVTGMIGKVEFSNAYSEYNFIDNDNCYRLVLVNSNIESIN